MGFIRILPGVISLNVTNVGQAFPYVWALWQIKITGKWSHIPKSRSGDITFIPQLIRNGTGKYAKIRTKVLNTGNNPTQLSILRSLHIFFDITSYFATRGLKIFYKNEEVNLVLYHLRFASCWLIIAYLWLNIILRQLLSLDLDINLLSLMLDVVDLALNTPRNYLSTHFMSKQLSFTIVTICFG